MDPTQQPVGADASLSAIRTLLGAALGWLAGKGYIPQDQVGSLVTALLVMAPVLWGVIEKFRRETQTQIRVAAAVNSASSPGPIAVSSTSQGANP